MFSMGLGQKNVNKNKICTFFKFPLFFDLIYHVDIVNILQKNWETYFNRNPRTYSGIAY